MRQAGEVGFKFLWYMVHILQELLSRVMVMFREGWNGTIVFFQYSAHSKSAEM